MNKFKLIFKNIKYFIPLLIKTNPMVIVLTLFNSIVCSFKNIIGVLFSERIIRGLVEKWEVNELIYLVIFYFALTFIINIVTTTSSFCSNYFGQKASFKIDEMFNQKISNVDYYNVENPEFADKISYAKKCLNEYSSGIYSITYTLGIVIECIITIAGLTSIIFLMDGYYIILVCFICLVINNIIYSKYLKVNLDYNSSIVRISRKQSYFNSGIYEFNNQKYLRLFQMKDLLSQKSDEINKKVFGLQKNVSKKLSALDCSSQTATYMLKKIMILLLLLLSYLNKNMELSVMIMLYNSMDIFDTNITRLIYVSKEYYNNCIYQDNFIDFMGTKSFFESGNQSLNKIETIEFKNVSFKYPRTDNYVLKNLSFSFSNKEKISLVGINGSGKTTIIKLLCRFFSVTEGEILINNININNYEYKNYMEKIAVVFQDFKIISFTIEDNIAVGQVNKKKLYNSLNRVNALEFVKKLDNKEHTYINKWFDKKGVEFSGGELQKFALSRALYKDGDLIVLDEPTSALDPIAESEIYYHLNEVIGNKNTIFISHRLSSCIFCDRILVLDNGSIIETGTHNELIKKKGLYCEMFKSQAQYYNS